jgi:hypothetical protein
LGKKNGTWSLSTFAYAEGVEIDLLFLDFETENVLSIEVI